MPARSPEELSKLFAEAVDAGDIEGLVALYEPEASFVPQPGQVVSGREAIRRSLSGILSLKPTFAIRTDKVILAGDIALLHSNWTLNGTGRDGKNISMAGRSAEVARRQPDDTWLYVIDNAYGAG